MNNIKTEREKNLSWLRDAPDELDVAIAQRHFDEAVDIIEKSMIKKVCLKLKLLINLFFLVREFISEHPKDSIYSEYA